MISKLRTNITVKDICDGFIYNELEGNGLFGLSGKPTIQLGHSSFTFHSSKWPLVPLYGKKPSKWEEITEIRPKY